MKKDRLFQYAHDEGVGVIIEEDTELITADEAYELWDKYFPEVKRQLEDGFQPQMVIWKDCETTADYHTEEKGIDHRECFVENDRIYKKTEIT